jgi:hypothetical protein
MDVPAAHRSPGPGEDAGVHGRAHPQLDHLGADRPDPVDVGAAAAAQEDPGMDRTPVTLRRDELPQRALGAPDIRGPQAVQDPH